MASPLRHLKAVVFDWAGTVVDHGSLAPMGVFVEAFAEFGVAVTVEEARQPMGIAKRPHVAALLAMPRIAAEWRRVRGSAPTEADIDAVYDVSCRRTSPSRRASPTSFPARGCGAAASRSRPEDRYHHRYTREIMNEITPVAAAQGFAPDSITCTGDAPEGRPTPLLLLQDVSRSRPLAGFGMHQGRRHGGGDRRGPQRRLLDRRRRRHRQCLRALAGGYARLSGAGAHYVIDGVADLMPVIYAVECRLARGRKAMSAKGGATSAEGDVNLTPRGTPGSPGSMRPPVPSSTRMRNIFCTSRCRRRRALDVHRKRQRRRTGRPSAAAASSIFTATACSSLATGIRRWWRRSRRSSTRSPLAAPLHKPARRSSLPAGWRRSHPEPLCKVLFAPSGAAAIGMALKLARLATAATRPSPCGNSFHGAKPRHHLGGRRGAVPPQHRAAPLRHRACAAARPGRALLRR